MIVEGAGWPSPAIDGEGGRALRAHLFPVRLLLPPCSIADTNGAHPKVFRCVERKDPPRRAGAAPSEEEAGPPPRRGGEPTSSSAEAAPARRGEPFLSPRRRTFGSAPLLLAEEQGGRSKRTGKRWARRALPPSPFRAGEGQPAPPTITGNDGFPLHVAGTCQVGQLPRQRGEAETPTSNQPLRVDQGRRLLGPVHFTLDLWLRLEAKPERALGQGATVGVLGMGVPRLACLRPTAWLTHGPVWPVFTSKRSRPSRGG